MGETSDGQFFNYDISYSCKIQSSPYGNLNTMSFEGVPRRKTREPQEVDDNEVVVYNHESLTSLFTKINLTNKVKVGQGQFGEVFVCKSTDGQKYALKEIDVAKNGIEDLKNEIEILGGLQHENIVTFVDSFPNVEQLSGVSKAFILMEFVPETLTSFLEKYKDWRSNERFIVTYIHQLLNAVYFVHSRNIVHCDIKCDNILFDDCKKQLKLCDFGLAHDLRNGKIKQPNRGTINFMSPQAINLPPTGYGKEADIWSCGCTFYEMMTGYPPYFEFESMTIMFQVGSGILKPEPPTGCSPLCQNFLMRCWVQNPAERATVEELLAYPFIQGDKKNYPTECSEYETDDMDVVIDEFKHCSLALHNDTKDCPEVNSDEFATCFALTPAANHDIEDLPSETLVLQQRCQEVDAENDAD